VINLEECSLGIRVVGRAVLFLLLLYLPDLSEEDPPHDHILHKCLLTEDFIKLPLSLDILRDAVKDLEREVSVVRKEGLSEIGEFDPLRILNVEILHEGVDLGLGIMNLHF
jgi:hypothetical protein